MRSVDEAAAILMEGTSVALTAHVQVVADMMKELLSETDLTEMGQLRRIDTLAHVAATVSYVALTTATEKLGEEQGLKMATLTSKVGTALCTLMIEEEE